MGFLARMREALLQAVTLRYLEEMSARYLGRYPRLAVFSFDFIGHHINVFGRYEREQLEALAAILGERSEAIALDIGANIGNHSLFLAEHFAEVHAFEPNPAILPLLRYNAAASGNIQVHPFGASNWDGAVEARIPLRNLGGGSVAALQPGSDGQVVRFDLRRLDGLQELASNRPIAFIKLDVEGHEPAAIEGMAELLQRHGPLIALEQNPGEIAAGSSPAIDRLRSLGYEYFYEIGPAPSRIPQRFPALLRAPLRLLEAGRTSNELRASVRPVTMLEQRAYPMLLASRAPVSLDGTQKL